MRIGILGSGLMGSKLGTLFARAGHDVVFSYARSMDKLKRLAKDAGHGARAGTPREATCGRLGPNSRFTSPRACRPDRVLSVHASLCPWSVPSLE